MPSVGEETKQLEFSYPVGGNVTCTRTLSYGLAVYYKHTTKPFQFENGNKISIQGLVANVQCFSHDGQNLGDNSSVHQQEKRYKLEWSVRAQKLYSAIKM